MLKPESFAEMRPQPYPLVCSASQYGELNMLVIGWTSDGRPWTVSTDKPSAPALISGPLRYDVPELYVNTSTGG